MDGLSSLAPETLASVIEWASRFFDRAAEVPEEYFGKAAALPLPWAPLTAYLAGAKVQPDPANGREYVAQNDGISGAVQPAFPLEIDATVLDGTVTWREDGIPGATEKILYGEGADVLRLPPYVAGTLEEVRLPDGSPTIEYVEQDGNLIRAYSNPGTFTLLDPGLSFTRNDWRFRHNAGWPLGVAIIVVARWGFVDTPGDVKMATVQIALKGVRESDPTYIKAADIEGTIIREDIPPAAKAIAAKWAERGLRFGL